MYGKWNISSEQSSCFSGTERERMNVNERMREWRDSDEGGNFVREEEVTTARRIGQRNEE